MEFAKYKTVTIPIVPWKHPSGREYWRFLAGDRKVTRATLTNAKDAALKHARATYTGKLDLDTLTESQMDAMRRMIDADPSCRLVDEFLVWHGRRAPKKNTGEAIDEFLASKEKNQGRSHENLRTLRSHMGFLAPVRGMVIADIVAASLPPLIGEARTRRNVRASWVTFFRWCVKMQYLPHGEVVAPERIDRPIIKRGQPTTYSPAELSILLANATKYAPWLYLAAFAGIRSAEVCPPKGSGKSPLDWSDFKWDRDLIVVRPETDKNSRRRVVPILPVLRRFLEPLAKDSGRVVSERRPPSSSPRNGVDSETTRLGKLIGGWKRNALRHSWISYRAAIVGISQTAMEAGNSESEARKSYVDAMGADVAAEWFSVGLERNVPECSPVFDSPDGA